MRCGAVSDSYERLLGDGCVGADYRAALEWGCDEHIAQTRETKQVLQPFIGGVAIAMPVELLCWLRYRRGRRLEHATYGHPLLESPLATLDPPVNAPPVSELSQLLELGVPHMRAYLSDS